MYLDVFGLTTKRVTVKQQITEEITLVQTKTEDKKV